MEFKIMFFSKWTKSERKGLPKAMTQSFKYKRVINDAITSTYGDTLDPQDSLMESSLKGLRS